MNYIITVSESIQNGNFFAITGTVSLVMRRMEQEEEEQQHQPPTVKPSLVRSSKKNYKLKHFKPEWLGNHLDGVQVKTWLTPKKPSAPFVKPQLIPLFRVEHLALPRGSTLSGLTIKPRYIRQLLLTQTKT